MEIDLRITAASASNVLGEYDHEVAFSNESQFVILYGPNGIGKTKFLEIVDALIRLNPVQLGGLPFQEATVRFSGGAALSVVRQPGTIDPGRQNLAHLRFSWTLPGREPFFWSYSPADDQSFETWLATQTPWSQVGNDVWQDLEDGEVAYTAELATRYRHRWPDRGSLGRKSHVPEPFASLSSSLTSHLIETQRLKIEEYLTRSGTRGRPSRQRLPSTIVEHAGTMKKLLSEALAENSVITQKLDRTFPSRFLSESGTPTSASERDIREKYEAQNRLRSRLANIAVIGLEPELALPKRELNSWEVSMLDLYLRDADQKLGSFDGLLDKINLLEDIVNARLLRKRFSVNAEAGMVVEHVDDYRIIELDALSSGEQHEIILMFDLLFNVREGSLVLIDEPEISLHVSWQVEFIADVQRIADLIGFQFIVATHSPQIINTWWERAVQLGPENEEFFVAIDWPE